jgi:hypothetical protein
MADKSLILGFLNEEGKKVSIRVNGVKDTLSQSEISAVMDTVILKNIFQSTGGDLKVKDYADMVDKTVDHIAVK